MQRCARLSYGPLPPTLPLSRSLSRARLRPIASPHPRRAAAGGGTYYITSDYWDGRRLTADGRTTHERGEGERWRPTGQSKTTRVGNLGHGR